MSTASTIPYHTPAPDGLAQTAIRSAGHELNELLRQRAEIVKRIGTVKQTLLFLAKTFGDDALTPEVFRLLGRGSSARKQPGFTRACRVILMEATAPLEARQGLRELQRRFPELIAHHKIPLASVTTVFNRLIGYGQARSFPNGKGRRVWEWVADRERGMELCALRTSGAGGTTPTGPMSEQ